LVYHFVMETLESKIASSRQTARPLNDRSPARLDFARRLRELRVPKGFRTARSLAKALGIDENRYTRYERAEVEPDLGLIRRICDVLGVTPSELLGSGEEREFDSRPDERLADAGAARSAEGRSVNGASGNSRGIAVEAAAWKLACAVAEARIGSRTDRSGDHGDANLLLLTASPLYQRLRQAPFETIAELAGDRELTGAAPGAAAAVLSAIDGLVIALRETA
jgi:transcriptional regulator with XRE-family HTH domain